MSKLIVTTQMPILQTETTDEVIFTRCRPEGLEHYREIIPSQWFLIL